MQAGERMGGGVMAEAIDYFLIQNILNRYSDAVDRGDFAKYLLQSFEGPAGG